MKANTLKIALLTLTLSACSQPNPVAVQAVVSTESQIKAQSYSYDSEKDLCDSSDGSIGFNLGIPGECVDSSNSNLDGQDLTGANLRGIKLQSSSLKNAILVDADLTGADLTKADLTGADLTGAVLEKAKMDDTAKAAIANRPITWTKCSDENGICSFKGTKTIRYGANDTYVSKVFTKQVSCSNSVFGDPLYGTFKHCEVSSAIVLPPAPTIDSLAWSLCSNENGQCSFSGVKLVRYGANDTYVMKIVENGLSCSNGTFGDPLVGTYKHCDVLDGFNISSAGFEDSLPWQSCSQEHDQCQFSGTHLVRYGANGTYTMKVAKDGIGCSNEVFGDPLYGTFKHCEFLPDDHLQSAIIKTKAHWSRCAEENGQCDFKGTKMVRYGESDHYVVQILTDGVSCSNQVFGDPFYGVVKHCEVARVENLDDLLTK